MRRRKRRTDDASARWHIRGIVPSDFRGLASYDWSPLVGERDTIYLFIVRDHARLGRVAETEAGEPVGYIVAARSCDGRAAFIFHTHVSPEWRGKGIGTALMREFEDGARSAGVGRVWFLARQEVRGFYEALGYCEVDGVLWPEAAEYVRCFKNAFVMAKDLAPTGAPA